MEQQFFLLEARQLRHIARLVGQLRERPEVQQFFKERGMKQPSTPDGFLRALMPEGLLTDSQIWALASECKSPMVFLVARSILLEEAEKFEYRHDPLADVRRSVPVLKREKVYA